MPVPGHLGAVVSYHPAFSFYAWLTLYHIQVSRRPLALREHTSFFPFMYMHMLKHWKDPLSVEERASAP